MQMALPTSSREKDSYAAFVVNGFSNRKKALDRFSTHERSELHKAAVLALPAVSKGTPISSRLNAQRQREINDARHSLSMIFSTLRSLAVQGLAIRGKNDESSNFRQLLHLRAQDSPILHKWLFLPQKYKWLSPNITNEILEGMAHATLRELCSEIKNGKFYSIMMDETTDISCKEQISFCIRTVNADFSVNEHVMGFYQTDDTRSATLFKCLTDMAIRLGLSITDCRGQCYDGAANMSGHVSGLQSLVREQEQRALYVHCRAHSLNLVAQDSVDNNPEIRNTMALVQKFVAFARGSPKRLAFLNFRPMEHHYVHFAQHGGFLGSHQSYPLLAIMLP